VYSIFLTCQINIFIQVFAEQGNVPNIIIAVSKALIFNNIDFNKEKLIKTVFSSSTL